jgi:hypothetical protein
MDENPTTQDRPESRRLNRPLLVNVDGSPTAWGVIVGLVAPVLVMVSIITVAIVQQ